MSAKTKSKSKPAPTPAANGADPAAEHVVEPDGYNTYPTPACNHPGDVLEDSRGARLFFHESGGPSRLPREFGVSDAYGPMNRHIGRGLEPRGVLEFVGRGWRWFRRKQRPDGRDDGFAPGEDGRDDVVIWEDCRVVGLVLNHGAHPGWFDGKPLALAVEVTAEGTSIRVVEMPAAEPTVGQRG